MANVPKLPGVPILSSYSVSTVPLLISDAIGILNAIFNGPSWGIFLNGVQAFDYNSVVDFDYKQDWAIADYQVEDGGFQSYDKVQLPFDVKVRVASGGDEAAREATLSSVLAAANTLELYDVVTPEGTFSSCNISHVDFKRSSHSGVGMIVIDIWFVEIRESATSTFSNTASPTAAAPFGTGNVASSSVHYSAGGFT